MEREAGPKPMQIRSLVSGSGCSRSSREGDEGVRGVYFASVWLGVEEEVGDGGIVSILSLLLISEMEVL